MCECIELAIRNSSPTVAHSPYCGRPKYGYIDPSRFYVEEQTEHIRSRKIETEKVMTCKMCA